MTVTMSSEGDSSKSVLSESNEKSGTDNNTDSSQDSHDVKDAKPVKETENNVEKKTDDEKPKGETNDGSDGDKKPEQKSDEKTGVDEKSKSNDVDTKAGKENDKSAKGEKREAVEKDEDEEEEDEDEGSDKDDDKEVPLLDQPLEKSGKRERKNVQRFNEEAKEPKGDGKLEFENGCGTALGDIPRVDASISRFKNDDLKLLHRLLFKVVGKTTQIKKNIRKFNGFEFKKDSEDFNKKVAAAQRFELKHLKVICEMLDLVKSGTKDEIVDRVLEFLLEPKDSGKPVGGGRPKRTAAVRANNRGYSSHDDYSSDERQTSRARRDKGKRPNLKDESSSESDKDFRPSDDASDEPPKVSKRKRGGRKKASSEEEEVSEVSAATSDESEDEPKTKRRKSTKVNNKTKAKATPGRRGRPAAAKKPTRSTRKAKDESSEEEEEEESDHKDEGSSSEDEPLAKKAKSSQPPTDDEIKEYVKKILEGANLEEITMKTVCQKVYDHYPDFDLAHKKDFIKTTVKSLIST